MTGKRWITVSAAAAFLAALHVSSSPALADDAIEEVVEVEVVEVIQAVESATGTPSGVLGTTQVVGRMHPALVHLPIGFLFLAVLMQLAALTRRWREMESAVTFALAATLAACIPALVSGFLRACEMWPAGNPTDTATWHRNLMLAMSALVALALALRYALGRRLTGPRQAAYLAVLFAAVAVAAAGGHAGGRLVFGDGFLPW